MNELEILRTIPPNYELIVKTINPTPETIFTYGNKIYAPNLPEGQGLEDHLLIHELMHSEQQGDDPDAWWNRYLEDTDFRLAQELECYAHQFNCVNKKAIPYKVKRIFLERIAGDLSSPLYGNLLSQPEAESKIRNKSKTI